MTVSAEDTSGAEISRRVEIEYHAREQLKKSRPVLIESLASIAWLAVCLFTVSQLEAPFIPTVFLVCSASMVAPLAFELFYLRRRVRAALMLLGTATGKR